MAGALRRHHVFGKQSSWSQEEQQCQIKRQHQCSDECHRWSCHLTMSTQSCCETWASSASCSVALLAYEHWQKSVGVLPGSKRWPPLLPAVLRGCISRSAFPAGSPGALVLLGCFYTRRMARKKQRLPTPSSLICWSWILLCSEGLMVSASRESMSDVPSLLFILVQSQLSYF